MKFIHSMLFWRQQLCGMNGLADRLGEQAHMELAWNISQIDDKKGVISSYGMPDFIKLFCFAHALVRKICAYKCSKSAMKMEKCIKRGAYFYRFKMKEQISA